MAFIYKTEKAWFEFIKDRNICDSVNFWHVGLRPAKIMSPGEHLFFYPKICDGIPVVRKITGCGEYDYFEEIVLEQAWERFRERNGAPTLELFLKKINLSHQAQANDGIDKRDKIGCMVLKNIIYFHHYVDPVTPIPKSVVRGKGISEEEAFQLIKKGIAK